MNSQQTFSFFQGCILLDNKVQRNFIGGYGKLSPSISSGCSLAISQATFEKNHKALFMKAALKVLPSSGKTVAFSNPVLERVNLLHEMRILSCQNEATF